MVPAASAGTRHLRVRVAALPYLFADRELLAVRSARRLGPADRQSTRLPGIHQGFAPPPADVFHGCEYAVQCADAHAAVSAGRLYKTGGHGGRWHGPAERRRGAM